MVGQERIRLIEGLKKGSFCCLQCSRGSTTSASSCSCATLASAKFNLRCHSSTRRLRKSSVKVWRGLASPQCAAGRCSLWFLGLLRPSTVSLLLALCPLLQGKTELFLRLFSGPFFLLIIAYFSPPTPHPLFSKEKWNWSHGGVLRWWVKRLRCSLIMNTMPLCTISTRLSGSSPLLSEILQPVWKCQKPTPWP